MLFRSNPKAGNLEYVKKVPVDVTHPQGYQLVFLGSSDSDMSTMRNIVNGNGNVGIGGNDSVVKGTAAESPLLYYSKIPESFDFEEIEINLFVHAWQRFGFIWMPYVTNNNTVIPQIKLNVHRDTNNTGNLAIWTNSNYNTDGNIHFENFEIEHYYTCVHASNFPFNKDIDDDPVASTTTSNPIGWWLEND